MALSYNQYPGDGANRNFSVAFQYLSRSHVTATINGVNAPFTWLSPSLIQLSTTPPAGTLVEVRRTTPRQVSQVDFVDGSTLTERDLDTGVLQSFYLAQEAFDVAGATLSQTLDGHLAANGRRLTLLGDPVAPQDAVTKQWAETVGGGFAGNAKSSADAAAASATAAAASNVTSHAAMDTSISAMNHSIAARDVALGARDVANTAANSANAERVAAQAARDTATVQAGIASTNRAAAEAAATAAEFSRLGAEGASNAANQWADAPENQPIFGNKYSARHWAAKAQAIAAGSAAAVGFVPTGDIQATDVQAAIQELDAEKAPLSHLHDDRYSQLGHTHGWAAITGKPTTFAPSAHTHPASDITGLDTAIAGKANLAGGNHFVGGDQRLQKNAARFVLQRGDNAASNDFPGLSILNTAGTEVGSLLFNHATTNWTLNGSAVWTAANFNPSAYLPLSGGVLSGNVEISGAYEVNFRLHRQNVEFWDFRAKNNGELGIFGSSGRQEVMWNANGHLWTRGYGWMHDYIWGVANERGSAHANAIDYVHRIRMSGYGEQQLWSGWGYYQPAVLTGCRFNQGFVDAVGFRTLQQHLPRHGGWHNCLVE